MKLPLIKYLPFIGLYFSGVDQVTGQNIGFGDSSVFFLGKSAIFCAQGDVTFARYIAGQDPLSLSEAKAATLIAKGNVDFGANRQVGNLSFRGDGNQELFGDQLEVRKFHVEKENDLTLRVSRVVANELELARGEVITDELTLFVRGRSMSGGEGFVNGPVFGLPDQNGDITFPVGASEEPNYLTLRNLEADTIYRVECRVPNQQSLLPDNQMRGLVRQYEWILVSPVETRARVEIDWNEIDIQNLVSASDDLEDIRSDEDLLVLSMFSEEDTLFHVINTSGGLQVDRILNTIEQGPAESGSFITLSQNPVRLALAVVPITTSDILYVPEAFTPTAAFEENRTFKPFFSGAQGTTLDNLSIVIYDSFGQQVWERMTTAEFQGENADLSAVEWDGRLNSGLEAPQGVYLYSVTFAYEVNGQIKSQKPLTGSVLLLR